VLPVGPGNVGVDLLAGGHAAAGSGSVFAPARQRLLHPPPLRPVRRRREAAALRPEPGPARGPGKSYSPDENIADFIPGPFAPGVGGPRLFF
jgi:hypothetical protein